MPRSNESQPYEDQTQDDLSVNYDSGIGSKLRGLKVTRRTVIKGSALLLVGACAPRPITAATEAVKTAKNPELELAPGNAEIINSLLTSVEKDNLNLKPEVLNLPNVSATSFQINLKTDIQGYPQALPFSFVNISVYNEDDAVAGLPREQRELISERLFMQHSSDDGSVKWAELIKNKEQLPNSPEIVQWLYPSTSAEVQSSVTENPAGGFSPDYVFAYEIPEVGQNEVTINFSLPWTQYPQGVLGWEPQTEGPYRITTYDQPDIKNYFHLAKQVEIIRAVDIKNEDIEGRFPEILKGSITNVVSLRDSDQITYAEEAYGKVGESQEEILLLVKEGDGKWVIAPNGKSTKVEKRLISLDVYDERIVGYVDWKQNQQTGKKEWVYIPPGDEFRAVDAEMAKIMEWLAAKEAESYPDSVGFRPYVKEFNNGLEINSPPDDPEKANLLYYKKAIESFTHAAQLKESGETYWADLGLKPDMSYEDFTQYLKDNNWIIPKLRFLTGVNGNNKIMVEFTDVDMKNINTFLFLESDLKNPLIFGFVNELRRKGTWFIGTSGNVPYDMWGFTVVGGKLLYVDGVYANSPEPTLYGTQSLNGGTNDPVISTAHFELAIRLNQTKTYLGKSSSTPWGSSYINTSVAKESNAWDYQPHPHMVDIYEKDKYIVETPLFTASK